MAECDNQDAENQTLSQLRRFLFLGTNESLWRTKLTNFDVNPDGVVHVLLKEGKGSDIVQTVLHFHKEGCSVNPEALAYALAVCSTTSDLVLKREVFSAIKEVCSSATMMLPFVHYHKQLMTPKGGWGRFMRRFLSSWYNERGGKDLAVETTRTSSRHQWNHKNVLCVSHIKPKNPEIGVVLKYLVRGLESAVKDFSAEAEAQDVLSYLKAVDELKHTTDQHAAARLIETHNLSLEHIPSMLLKSKEIWSCLIPRLKTSQLLLQVPRLHKLGLLKLNSIHLKALLERLRDENALADGDLGPLETFLSIRKWEASNRLIPGKTMIRQNIPQLDEALMNLHMASFKAIASTGKRYLIAVDVCSTMASTHTSGCNSLSPADVTMVVLMALVRSEVSNITAVAFSTKELVPIDVNNKMSLSDIAQRMRNVPAGPVDVSAPVQWAIERKKAFDIMLVFTDNQTSFGDIHPVAALKEYRATLNLPNTRFMTFALCCNEFSLASSDDPDMLDVAGFHIKLLQVIQDYAQKVF